MSPNRLSGEKSPYLLQHANNPVDWRPWGEQAFAEARRLKRPILLSIGYAACHWCHVMEHESFTDPAIAELMNRHFICIKLDREERPDVDALYMSAVQALGAQGGWPLNVFLTPDLKPFFGGTYFPPQPRWGQPGWTQLLERIAALWGERQAELEADAGRLAAALTKASSAPRGIPVPPSREILESAEEAFAGAFDPEQAGFGGAPKFPMPSYQRFLLRRGARGSERCGEMAQKSLRAMIGGGIFDQVGGGFHRYSTDAAWRVPHFEKMLYDNVQLLENLADAIRQKPDDALRTALKRTVDYLGRDLRSSGGALLSAEDADSEGAEGAFYLWKKSEIDSLLSARSAAFCSRFGAEAQGNAPQDPHGEFAGRNILYDRDPAAMPDPDAEKALSLLLTARQKRPRPLRDDKVLASWNGLALTGLSCAYLASGDPKPLKLAQGAARFLRAHLWEEKTRTLWRRWREGERAVPGLAEDYASMTQGLLDLYEADFDPSWLSWSVQLSEEALSRFRAPGGGLWRTAQGAAPELLARILDEHDGVEPASSSVMTDAALRLYALTGRAELRDFADETLSRFGPLMAERPLAMSYMLCALDRALGRSRGVVIAGLDGPGGPELLAVLRACLRPDLAVAAFRRADQETLAGLLPVVASMRAAPRAAAYVCTGKACGLPIEDPAELARNLDS